jgi:group I intron endonuclease
MNGKIYLIRNLVNGKYYIGQTTNSLNKRLNDHCCYSHNLHFKSAIKKYGRKNFVIEPLVENIQTQEELDNFEKLWILTTRSYDRKVGYNIEMGGNGRGKVSNETRAKLSSLMKGKIISPETRAKMSASAKGKIRSPETQAKMSASMKGKIISPEQRAKMSASMKGNSNHKGKTHTLETRAKISASLKGKIPWNTGKIHSPETRAKISASLKGNTNKKAIKE